MFVGEDGRLGNVNLTSGLSQRIGGNLSFVSIIIICTIFYIHYNNVPLPHIEQTNEELSMAYVFLKIFV